MATATAAPAASRTAVAAVATTSAAAAAPAAADPQAIVLQAVKKITTIATLPEVTSRIIQTVEDPKSTASQLHKIVAHDPALVTRILKVVNSAFYGLPGQIGSIERAIVMLGLNAVKNIAVAASLGQLFRGVRLTDEFTAKDLWTHCVGVGVAAREIARQIKAPVADEAFLAGMIHDLGLLVSLQIWPERLREVCDRVVTTAAADFCAVEREITGVDHQQLGAALAEHWKFPRSCQQVAGHHHDPATLSVDSRLLATLVYAGDIVCCQAKQGFNLTALRQTLDNDLLSSVGIDRAVVERVGQNLPATLASAATLMG